MSGRNGVARRRIRTTAGTGAALALVLGYGTVTGGLGQAAAGELPQFSDCDEFTAYMRSVAESEVSAYGLGGGPMMYKTAPMTAEGSDSRAGAAPTAAVGNGPTGTNTQERGVDEPDIAKIDGTRVLSLVNGKLTVVDASGRKPKLAATHSFPENEYPSELLVLDNHRVLVLGTGYEEQDPATDPAAEPAGKRAPGFAPEHYRPASPYVVLTLLDLTNIARPKLIRTEKITGSYITGRLTDGVARIVLTSQPRIAFSAPREGEPEALALARNKKAVRDAKAEDFLPERQVFDKAGKPVRTAPLMGCGAVRHPTVHSGLGIISVLTLDTADDGARLDKGRATGVVSNGELVYASADRLYVATTDGGWDSPRPIDVSTNRPREQEMRTRIHAFNVTGRNDSPYVASGSVSGFLLGRWALSEHEGNLRIATTTGRPWAPPEETPSSQSSVVVLAERGDELRKIGSVSGLGKGETIRAVRWFDDIAAIVTFRQTDPLYLVDLADPAHPAVRGELKIPGYSAYLHPVGGDRLLGVGQDADQTGRVTGLQVSSFDLRNLARPTRTAAVGYGRGYTDVEHDSRAFTYLPGRRLAVLPAWVTQKVPCPPDAQCLTAEGKPSFVGEIQVPAALGITVGADGTLTKAGKFVADSYILRVLPIGDRLVAITGNAIVFLNPNTFAPTGSVKIAPDQPKPMPIEDAAATTAPPPPAA